MSVILSKAKDLGLGATDSAAEVLRFAQDDNLRGAASRPLDPAARGVAGEHVHDAALAEADDLPPRGNLHAVDQLAAPVHDVIDRSCRAGTRGGRANPEVAVGVAARA